MKAQMVKAGALQLTMFIVVVIALLLTAFLILVHTHKRFNIQTDFVLETIDTANEGIDYVLQNDVRLNDTLLVDLHDEDYKTLKVHCDYWGLFKKVVTLSKVKNRRFKKVALIGGVQPDQNRIALYVEDQNRPFVVVGNTKVQGLAYLPKQGVRTGYISGHSYYGSQLIYGATRTSSTLPKPLKETLEQIETIHKNINAIDPNQYLDLSKRRTHQNSFFNPLQVVYSPTDLQLSGVSLAGHILIQSKTKITIDATSNLKDVVLIAPKIDIKSGTKGRFQALATKAITIGKNCDFEYPSAFILNEDKKSHLSMNKISNTNETAFIKIHKGTNIKGVILYLGDTKNYKAQVFIDKNVTVTGELYCNKNLELLGTVHGGVFTSNFVANQSGSSYQNHLYNGTILTDELPQEYVGLAYEKTKKGVLKWLY
ncbi:hypothetical protein [Thalassobellus citreus]|uniref:hypothetical protein n=1 Tax=Thalassobellus citreus TaxID=3367752 RepID=UPI003796F94D